MSRQSQLDLFIEVDVLTAGTTAEVVNAIFEALLYQRNQIPFVYKTYRYYVNKWQEQKSDETSGHGEGYNAQNFQVERRKEQATTTKEAISTMRQTIASIFEQNFIKSIRFLFGPTVFTAKEAYTLHIPTENISPNHYYDHHKISSNKLNQTLLSFLTSENLYTVFSKNLNATNIFLELELLQKDNIELTTRKDSLQNAKIFPKDFLTLPPSCKDIHINLLHKQSSPAHQEQLKCCKELKVFEDQINMKYEKEKENYKCEKKLANFSSEWWEAEIFVRGFNDQPSKRCNIWS